MVRACLQLKYMSWKHTATKVINIPQCDVRKGIDYDTHLAKRRGRGHANGAVPGCIDHVGVLLDIAIQIE